MIPSKTGISAFVAATAVVAACGGAAGERAPATGEMGHAKGHGHHHRFEDAASWSAVFDDPARDEWQKPGQVVEIVKVSPGMTVADVGAGTGYFSVHLARAVGPEGRVLAVDVEPDMVRWLGDRARRERLEQVEAVLAAADDPRLPAGKVDRILVVDTWHHVEGRPAYAKRLAAALAPGGTVTVVDFRKDAPHGPPPAARVTEAEVIRDLEEGGLSASVVDAGLPYQFVVQGRTR
jgi:predicted methyltransferase